MERKPLVAANLKMNDLPEGALEEDSPYRERGDVDVIVFATYLDIQQCLDSQLITGAQLGQCHPEPKGAFTGDVSMQMLDKLGVRYVICGHSERRKNHGETNEDVKLQAIAALEANIHPVICVGETKKERDAGKEKEVVKAQLEGFPLNSEGYTIAYEPVWAIGEDADRPATPEEAQEMIEYIRSLLPKERRKEVRILYGGSVKPDQESEETLRKPDVDGFLVGGASLKLKEFRQIVEMTARVAAEEE